MNLQSLKQNFLMYLQDKFDKEGKNTNVFQNPEMSILKYGSEFLAYAKQELGGVKSVFNSSDKSGLGVDVSNLTLNDLLNGNFPSTNETNEQNYIPNPDSGIDTPITTFPPVDTYAFDKLLNGSNKEFDTDAINKLLPDGMKLENLLGKNIPINNFADSYNHKAFDSINDLIAQQQGLHEQLGELSQKDLIKSQIDKDKDGNISDDEQSDFVQSLRREDGLLEEGTVSGLLDNQKNIREKLDKAYSDEKVIKALDKDKDGYLSEQEKKDFEDFLRKNGGVLSEKVVDKALEQINDGTFSYDNPILPEEEVAEPTSPADVPTTDPVQDTSHSGGASGTNSNGGSGGDYSPTNNQNTTDTQNAPQNLESMTLEQLEAKKTEKQGEVDKAQADVNAVYSGDNEAVKGAMQSEQDAREAYDKIVEEDDSISDELKQKRTENLDAISQKETDINNKKVEINNKQTEIKNQETVISSVESEISALGSAISALEAQKTTGDDDASKQKNAEIDAKIQEAKAKKDDLENKKLPAEKDKKAALEAEKTTLESDLSSLETELDNLKTAKADIEKELLENCSPETKEALQKAMQDYNDAKDKVKTVQQEELTKAQDVLSTKQKELDEINTQIDAKKAEETKNEYKVNNLNFDFEENLSDYQKSEIESVKKIFEEHKEEYEKVAQATGLPAELICAIHYREGSCDFSTYLHNGDKLGKTTTHVPAGIYFDNWTDAAIHAIKSGNYYSKFDKNDINSYYEYAERYNGLGYRNKGLASPYVWAGTTKYTGGMYVADHKFSASAKDKRVGVAVLLKHLMA